jgi:hypothetical protein
MSTELDQFRREVADAHGLGASAVPFLAGATADEVEASARGLAQLVHAGSPAREPKPAERNIFAVAATAKQARKQELHRLFTGQAVGQPRDEHGRYATGFDGGTRRSLPPPKSTHGQWLGEVIRSRSADRGASF